MTEEVIIKVGTTGDGSVDKLAENLVKSKIEANRLSDELKKLNAELKKLKQEDESYSQVLSDVTRKEVELANAKVKRTSATRELMSVTKQLAIDSNIVGGVTSNVDTAFKTLISTLYAYNNLTDVSQKKTLDVVNAFTAYVAGSNAAGASLNNLNIETNAANAASQSLAANANAAAASTANVGNSAELAKQGYENFVAAINTSITAFHILDAEIDTLEQGMQDIKQTALGMDIDLFSDETEEAIKLRAEYRQLEAAADDLVEAQTTLANSTKILANNVGSIGMASEKTGNTLKKQASDLSKYQQSVLAGKQPMQSFNQILRETPNFAIDARIGIMSLSNNIMPFVDEVRNASKAGMTFSQIIKTLGASLMGIQGIFLILTIALTAFSNPKFVEWFDSLFNSTKRVNGGFNTLADTMRGLNKTMSDGGGVYKQAIADIEKMTITLKNSKGNTELSKKAVEEYNKTLGVTFGKVNDVDSALKAINKNQDAYIEAMKNMAFANTFFNKSAEASVKIMDISTKSNSELVGKNAEWYINEITKVDKIANSTKKRLKELISSGATEQQIKVQQDLVDEYDKKQSDLRTAYNNDASKERKKQITEVEKEQDNSLKQAEKYYKKYSDIFKKNKFVIDESNPDKKDDNNNKGDSSYGGQSQKSTKEIFDAINKEIEAGLKKGRDITEREILLRNLFLAKSGEDLLNAQFKLDKFDLDRSTKTAGEKATTLKKLTEKYNDDFLKLTDDRIVREGSWYDKAYDEGRLTYSQYLKAKLEYLKKYGLDTAEVERLIQSESIRKYEEFMQSLESGLSSMAQISDSFASMYQTKMDITNQYYDAEEARIEQSLMSEKEKNDALTRLDKERYAALKEDFKRKKQLEIASAWINFAAGSVRIWSGVNASTGPLGWIASGIQQAALLATTIANVKTIQSQQLGAPSPRSSGGGSSGGSSSANIALNPAKDALTSRDENLNTMAKANQKDAPTNVVKVSEINDVQSRVKVREENASY